MVKLSDAWKNLEKAVAAKLRGERIVRGNDYGKSMLDVEHPYFSIDCKYRASLAIWGWYKKLKTDTKKLYPNSGKIALLASRSKNSSTILITLSIDDFIECLNRKDIYDYIKGENDDREQEH